MSGEIDTAHLRRAKVIARAFANTAEHHRRTGLIAGGIALLGCGLAFASGRIEPKGVALAVAVLFAVSCYRSIRSANAFIDPTASPVLKAIATAPADILAIVFEAKRSVVKITTEDAMLDVRVDDKIPAEPLLRALEAHAPNATVARE